MSDPFKLSFFKRIVPKPMESKPEDDDGPSISEQARGRLLFTVGEITEPASLGDVRRHCRQQTADLILGRRFPSTGGENETSDPLSTHNTDNIREPMAELNVPIAIVHPQTQSITPSPMQVAEEEVLSGNVTPQELENGDGAMDANFFGNNAPRAASPPITTEPINKVVQPIEGNVPVAPTSGNSHRLSRFGLTSPTAISQIKSTQGHRCREIIEPLPQFINQLPYQPVLPPNPIPTDRHKEANKIHETILPSCERAGFLFVYDDGLCKARTINGILYHNQMNGRERVLMITSFSNREFYGSRSRDSNDLMPAKSMNYFDYGSLDSVENSNFKRGLILCSYRQLCNTVTAPNMVHQSRLHQLVTWLGPDGIIIFDQCHVAKRESLESAVLTLQDILPAARVVYTVEKNSISASCTAFMKRLGFWGLGTSYPRFQDFLTAFMCNQYEANGPIQSNNLSSFKDAIISDEEMTA